MSKTEQSIKTKIETSGIPLRHWHAKLQQGAKTCYDAAFVIDGAKRQALLAQDPKSADIIKPMIRGRDFVKDGFVFKDTWLITTGNL